MAGSWLAIDCLLTTISPLIKGSYDGRISGKIGLELLALQQQLFAQWHQWQNGAVEWLTFQLNCRLIRQHFEGKLRQMVDLGFARKSEYHGPRPCGPASNS